MEMPILSEIEQSGSDILRTMWSTLDRSIGWLLFPCPVTCSTAARASRSYLCAMARRDTMDAQIMARWPWSIAIPSKQPSFPNTTRNEKAAFSRQGQGTEESKGQGQEGTGWDAVSNSTSSRSSLESHVISEHAAFIHCGVITGRTTAPCTSCCHEKERNKLTTRAADPSAGEPQGAITGHHEVTALSCHEAGQSQEGFGRGEVVQAELTYSLAELSGCQCGEVEAVLSGLREARHRTCSTSGQCLRGGETSSRRLGSFEEGGQGHRGRRDRWQIRDGSGDLGRRESGGNGQLGPSSQRRYESVVTEPRKFEKSGRVCRRGERPQTAQTSSSGRAWRFFYASALGAFCQARSIDPKEIGYGLHSHEAWSSCQLKWSHRATRKAWFVSEWQAEIDALDEAFAFGNAWTSPVPIERKGCQVTPENKKRCTFCDDIQVYFGLDEEIRAFSTKIAHDYLQQWPDKPWRLRFSSRCSPQNDRALEKPMPYQLDDVSVSPDPSQQFPQTEVQPSAAVDGQKSSVLITHQHSDPLEAPTFLRQFVDQEEGDRVHLRRIDPNHLPQWWSQLRLLHEQVGIVECLEEGKIIYVNSWYLHGTEVRRCEMPRTLRLDSQWHEWIDVIKETWHDRLHHDLPVEFGIVSPHPPATVFEAHAAHIILGQALQPHDRVGVVSGIFRSATRDAIMHTAQVLPHALTHSEAVALVPAILQCESRMCMSRMAQHTLRDDRPELTPMFTSVVVEVHPAADDEDGFSSFMAAGARSRTGLTPVSSLAVVDQRGAAQQEDEEHLDNEFNGADAEDTESTEEDPYWRLSVVFSVHGPPQEGQVNAVNHRLARTNVARLANIAVDQLRAFHCVPHPPEDLQQRGVHVFLAQHEHDVPEHPRLAFVLVDVEFHPAAPGRQFERIRCPIYVPTVLSRHQILRVMDVFLYASYVQDTCLVWHNGQLIQQDAGLYARLFHGDYIRIALPPPLTVMRNIPTRCIARLLQMGVAAEDVEAFYWISNVDENLEGMPTQLSVVQEVDSSFDESNHSETTSLFQTGLSRGSRGRSTTYHKSEDFEALRLQYCQQQEVPLGINTPNLPVQELPWFENELLPLWNSMASPGPGGMERTITIFAWYNDHHRHTICDSPRRVQLFEDVLEWRTLITRVWSDMIDDSVDLHFFAVWPRPSHEQLDIAAHVILLQRPLPHFKSLHISVWDNQVNAGVPRSWVLMLPNQLTLRLCIDIMGYTNFCQPLQNDAWCSLWHGD